MFVSLKIISINKNNEYVLQNEKSKKQHTLMLEFYNVKNPKVGDRLFISKNLLDINFEGFCQPYAFTVANENEIEKFAQNNFDNEIAVLFNSNNKTILKRIYG